MDLIYLRPSGENFLLGRRQEVEKNLPDIAKSRDTSMNNKKQNSFLF